MEFSPPDIGQKEIDAATEVLRSGWVTTGPKTKEFECEIAKYCSTEHAICMNSATACLEAALRLLGIGPGDEVILPAYTYSASAASVIHVGALPVLVDCSPNSFEMDYNLVYSLINKNTKAVMPVDLGGVLCDYGRIFEVVKTKRNIFRPKNTLQEKVGRVTILADSAHSFGASYGEILSGGFADLTVFSFHAVKNLTTAEGGAIVWRKNLGSDEIYTMLSLLSLHGQSKDALAKTTPGAWEYDIVLPGYKFNMTDINAAIGLVQLGRFSGMLTKRKNLAKIYNEVLRNSNVKIFQSDSKLSGSSMHLYMVNLSGKIESERNAIIIKMAEKGIATNVHYKPLPMFSAYKNIGFDIKNFPNTFAMYENEITLPLHTLMRNDDAQYCAETLLKILV